MRKWIFGLGIILLISGLILILSSTSPVQTYAGQVEVGRVSDPYKPWNVTGFFKEDDRISVLIKPGTGWGDYPFEPPTMYVPEYHVGVLLRIYDPQGKNTTLTIPYVRAGVSVAILPDCIHVSCHDGILWEDGVDYGVVQQDGDYTAQCFGVYPAGKAPPAEMIVYRQGPTTEYPFDFLFLAGIPICVLGVAVSIWGFKAKPKRTPRFKSKR